MKFNGLTDKRNVFLLLGCYCNNPMLFNQEEYKTNKYDYPDQFHKIIFGAISNIVKKSNKIKMISAVEIENEISSFANSLKIFNDNNGFEYVESAIEEAKDKVCNIDLYRDEVRKYSLLRNAQDELGMDISFIYEEFDDLDTNDPNLVEKQQKMDKFNKMKSTEVSALINNKFLKFKEMWDVSESDNYSFHIGEGIKERIQEHKDQINTWGYPFQSGYMTTIFRGMRGKKFMVKSSKSGGGKSRASMAEACNISCDMIYDWDKRQWISTGEAEECLFISTELTKEEVQDCILAHISGIEEDRIAEWKDITPEEEAIIWASGDLMAKATMKLHCEYMPDFTIDSIKDKIESWVISNQVQYVFFDYINDSPSLYKYYIEKTGVRLQTHRILFLFSQSLKSIANKYDIYLGSSTQLSSNWKEEKDANALKGSKAIIEKADYGVIALPATSQDLKLLSKIYESGFYKIPNYCYHIFKNRGGKWKSVIVWTQLNMGTMREIDCFVTDSDYKLITDIESTALEFTLESVGELTKFEDSNMKGKDVKEYVSALNKTEL